MAADYMAEQLGAIRADIADLKNGRVVHRSATVTTSDAVTSTFAVTLPDGQTLDPLTAPPQFLPSPGQAVTLRTQGATPIYDPVGIATGAVADREVASLSVGKLATGVLAANVTVSGRIATALTGARVEMNAQGLQKFDAAGNLTVNVTGTTNLLTGTLKTALSGRRVEAGVTGTVGRLSMIGADETTSGLLESYIDAAVESIRISNPVAGAWEGWNSVVFQSNQRVYLSGGDIKVSFGGASTGLRQFAVYEAADNGTPGVQPDRTERLRMDASRSSVRGPDGVTTVEVTNNVIRNYVGDVNFEGSIDFLRHGIADTALRSPKILLRAEGQNHGGHLKYVVDAALTSPRIEVTNTADTGFLALWASAFTVNSAPEGKTNITDLGGSAMDRVRAMRPRTYQRTAPGGETRTRDGRPLPIPAWTGPTEVGLVADEAPAEVVVGDGEGVNVYSLAVLTAAAVKELDARLALVERGRP